MQGFICKWKLSKCQIGKKKFLELHSGNVRGDVNVIAQSTFALPQYIHVRAKKERP